MTARNDDSQKETASKVEKLQEATGQDADARINREAQDTIGRRLQQVYGQLVSEPLPDKVKDLLAQLANSEKKAKGIE